MSINCLLNCLWGKMSDEEVQAAKSGDNKAINKLIVGLRDGRWGELKRRFTSKRDKNAKTGSGGGKRADYDDLDILVQRILTSKDGGGKAAIDGLDVQSDGGGVVEEAGGSSPSAPNLDAATNEIFGDEAGEESIQDGPKPIAKDTVFIPFSPLKSNPQARLRKRQRCDSEVEDMKKELAVAQIEYAKKKTEYYDLLCMKLRSEIAFGEALGQFALDGDSRA
ncbi:hypothetical protein FOZ63_013130 [Perkinsus olseni]|uniref:Uncharacterized protein n=1 Tax=Perkinsus olseni TaxID=32597 RepID=A0A7J6RQ20_PEROL|nr:hypothetical protein FOZ63_013130 [Perkinsus olseni]KAF4722306.1 hypothetical protein FOZ62_010845 [Perkinsus olseni]